MVGVWVWATTPRRRRCGEQCCDPGSLGPATPGAFIDQALLLLLQTSMLPA